MPEELNREPETAPTTDQQPLGEGADFDGAAEARNAPAPPEAATAAASAGRVRLTGISSEAYRHPMDRQAAVALRALPGFEMAVAKFSQYSVEKILYHEQCATAVRVTPRQMSRLHKLLLEACGVLDLPEPAMFVSQTPLANAFALGRDFPTLVLWTGLIELLDEEEQLAVIAHELGHIHCGHTLPLLVAIVLEQLARIGGMRAGVGDLFTLPLRASLLEWMRKAEFSADRAALLVVQDPEVVFSALFKLTGGSPKVFEQMDREEYLKQADEYEKPEWSKLDKFYKTMLESEKSHPIPVLRAREVLRWGAGDEYKALVSGQYLRRDDPSVTGSGLGNWFRDLRAKASGNGGSTKDVAAPGAALPRTLSGATLTCTDCGQETDAAFSFCPNCGKDLPKAEPTAAAEATAPEEGPEADA